MAIVAGAVIVWGLILGGLIGWARVAGGAVILLFAAAYVRSERKRRAPSESPPDGRR